LKLGVFVSMHSRVDVNIVKRLPVRKCSNSMRPTGLRTPGTAAELPS
jgi:hypothetical protein